MTTFKCKKCGHTESSMHLREVSVSLGWTSSHVRTVAPCTMCVRCGDLAVHAEITIGKYMNLVPGAAPPPPPGDRQADPAPAPAPQQVARLSVVPDEEQQAK